MPDQCSGVTLKSGVSKVEVAFTPLMPGSAFNNETPPAGEVLHLTLDAGLDGSGNPTFPDVSPGRLTGVCSGATCPQVGRQGHSGDAALFDGVDDAVTLPKFRRLHERDGIGLDQAQRRQHEPGDGPLLQRAWRTAASC